MEKTLLDNRIWEIDFARGVAICIVVIVHAVVDLKCFSSLSFDYPGWFYLLKQYGGVFFVILSGVSAFFSHRSVKRGFIVFLIGCCFTALTEFIDRTGLQNPPIYIRWGVLHLIGFCMMVYPLLKSIKPVPLFAVGAVIVVGGYIIHEYRFDVEYLFMFGFRNAAWGAFDYFPILPHLGWFMIGNGLAKLLYGVHRISLFPGMEYELSSGENEKPVIRFFMYCGRRSLQIYVIHQILFYIIAGKI